METVIIINPDRFSRQSFPPFLFICRALLEANYKVKCIGARKYNTLPVSDNFEFFSPFKSKPILYGVWFVIYQIYKTLVLVLKNKISAIIVFRSCDSITHFLLAAIFRLPLVFFVDHLPWEKNFYSEIRNPLCMLRIVGFCLSSKLIVSSNVIAEKLITNLPFLKSKIIIEPYSPDIYQKTAPELLRQNLISKFNIENPILVLCGSLDIECSIRAFSKFQNLILFLQIDESDSKYYIGLAQSLGLLERIEFVSLEVDLIELIPAMNLVISPGSGKYVLSALSTGVPVLISENNESREWIYSNKFLFKNNSVESLYHAAYKAIFDSNWSKSGIDECNSHLERFSEPWRIRTIKQITSVIK